VATGAGFGWGAGGLVSVQKRKPNDTKNPQTNVSRSQN
jgi:hypothetical protein